MVTNYELSELDITNILNEYSIGRYIPHEYIFTGSNYVYKIRTTHGSFILKIYNEPNLKLVKYQIALMEFLKKSDVSIPLIIDTKKGKGLLIWNGEKIAIQTFVEGREIKYPNEKLAKDLGQKIGALARALARFDAKKPKGFENLLTKDIEWNGEIVNKQDLEAESRELIQEIKGLNLSHLKKSIIHGDIHQHNFLVKGDTVLAIIDWDNAQESFRVQELAVIISAIFITRRKINEGPLKIFLYEYQKRVRLNKEEKKALWYFIKRQWLLSASWCYNQLKSHSKNKKQFSDWAKEHLEKYEAFQKISLGEWNIILDESK